jgi:hypothetical protein
VIYCDDDWRRDAARSRRGGEVGSVPVAVKRLGELFGLDKLVGLGGEEVDVVLFEPESVD